MALGLLNDDGAWHDALNEASTWASGVHLRNMFCSMLMFSEIADPVRLWESHWVHLTDDLLRATRYEVGNFEMQLSSDELQNLGLLEIERALNRNGRSLRHFPLMPTPSVEAIAHATNRLIIDELDYDMSDELLRFESLARGLNSNQYRVFRSVIDAYHRGDGGLFLLYGSGGTGKTYLWNTIISKFRSDKRIVLAVASSRIASLLLPGGKTAHSVFKIPLQPDETSVCFLDKRSERAELIQEMALVIWDEAPMINQLAFKVVNRHLKDIGDNENAFADKLVVLWGRFQTNTYSGCTWQPQIHCYCYSS